MLDPFAALSLIPPLCRTVSPRDQTTCEGSTVTWAPLSNINMSLFVAVIAAMLIVTVRRLIACRNVFVVVLVFVFVFTTPPPRPTQRPPTPLENEKGEEEEGVEEEVEEVEEEEGEEEEE